MVALFIVPCTRGGFADDQLIKKDGTIITGQIVGVADGRVTVNIKSANGGVAKVPYYITDLESVNMTPPEAVAKLQGANPAVVVSTLEPLVKQYSGLPTDWVVEAMAQLAEAYASQNQGDRATALYNQIDTLYPNSKYHAQAVAGKALLSLKQGKVDEAITAVQPIITEANKNLAPSPTEGRLYASAFLVYGQALQAQKKLPQALEAYLTVKTMFYQNPALVEQADQMAKSLRDQNPGLGVD